MNGSIRMGTMLSQVRWALVFAIMLTTTSFAAEQPDIVKAAIEDARKQCVEAEGKPGPGEVMARTIDLDGNGRDDLVLDFGKLECDGAQTLFCGTGGCLLQIYLWQRGMEWKLVFDENVRGWKPIKAGGKPALLFHLHGSACNRVGYYDCRKTFVFDKGTLRPR
jgi:hypothetical protein